MKKYALLIGVEDYRDKMISRLNFARADAIALADRLSVCCGFDQVRVLADNSGENEPLLVNIVTALRDTSAELRPDDLFLFFFAGHGIEKDGHGYLLARDSLQGFPEHGSLSLELLRKNFAHLSAGKRIVLLDACRNSPDAAKSDTSNCMSDVISRDIVAAARSHPTAGTTTALLAACRSGQRAYEWPAKGHGVFTQYLIEGLEQAAWTEEGLEFRHLARYAAGQVRQWSAGMPGLPLPQEPWYEEFGDPETMLLAVKKPLANSTVNSPQISTTLTPTPPIRTKQTSAWWVVIDDQELGPLDAATVQEWIDQGKVTCTTECWSEGLDAWQAIGEIAAWTNAFPAHETSVLGRPPSRRPTIRRPEFLKPVPDATYVRLGGLFAGSEEAQDRQRQWVEKGYPLEVVMKKTGIVFRLIPPGEFMMGSKEDPEAFSHEKPQHKVTIIAPLYVGKYPVTQQQWETVMEINPAHYQKGRILKERRVKKSFWSREETLIQEEVRLETETKDHPVEKVSWDECQRFLNRVHQMLDLEFWKSIRLLTEAEWEYTCRAGTTDPRYGNVDVISWSSGNSGGSTRLVGQKLANAWGICDMIGNVWEWCEDTWHDTYEQAPNDGRAFSVAGSARVIRGGGWIGDVRYCRSASRNWNTHGLRYDNLGFRVAFSSVDQSGKRAGRYGSGAGNT